MNNQQIDDWLKSFQDEVNRVAGNEFLQWTVSIWDVNNSNGPVDPARNKKVDLVTTNEFPFLDMKMGWTPSNFLNFSVYRKENQVLKYLEKGSCHTSSTFKAIPIGVFKHLAKLTSKTVETRPLSIQQVYPDHAAALLKANLISKEKEFPTFDQLWKDKNPKPAISKRRNTRNVYFCVGYCHFWKKPIIAIINKLIDEKYPELKWLRVRMSHHRFSNLKELFGGDLNSKVMSEVKSLDFFPKKDCNCSSAKNK